MFVFREPLLFHFVSLYYSLNNSQYNLLGNTNPSFSKRQFKLKILRNSEFVDFLPTSILPLIIFSELSALLSVAFKLHHLRIG